MLFFAAAHCRWDNRSMLVSSWKHKSKHTGTTLAVDVTINTTNTPVFSLPTTHDPDCHFLLSAAWMIGCRTFPLDTILPDSPQNNFSPHYKTFSLPGCWSKNLKKKMTLTRTPDPNRSIPINFVHVNGRSPDRHRASAGGIQGENKGGVIVQEICPGLYPG